MLYSSLYRFKPTSVISALVRQVLINAARNGYIEVREHIRYEKTDIHTDIYKLKVTPCANNCSRYNYDFSVIVNRYRGRVSVSLDSDCVEFAKTSNLSSLCIGGVKLTVGNGIRHAFLIDIAPYTKSVVYRLDSITGYELEPRGVTVLYYTTNYITKLEPLLRKAKYEVVSDIVVPMLGIVKFFMLSPFDDPRTAIYLPAIPLRVELYTPTHTRTSWVEYDASDYDRESPHLVFVPEMIKYNVVYTLVRLTHFGYVYRSIMNYKKFENILSRLEDLVELP